MPQGRGARDLRPAVGPGEPVPVDLAAFANPRGV